MNPEALTIAVLSIVFLATLTRTTLGFGGPLISMPLLTLVVGIQTATPLSALVASTNAMTILLCNWRSVRLSSAWRLVLASLLGIPIGLLFLKGTYDGVVRAVLALIVISFSLYSLAKPRLFTLVTERSAFLFGFVAGILGGAYNTNGPPIVLYGTLRKWPSETFRATLQGYFLPTGLLILLSHGLAGLWTPNVLRLYLLSLPFTFLAFGLGAKLNHSIPSGKFDQIVHLFLITIGVVLLFG
jgi:hypothetical protein